MSNPTKTVLLADWVVPVTAPPIANGIVVVANGGIKFVGSQQQLESLESPTVNDHETIQLDGVLIPGLVNAHTHLEFSDIPSPLGHQGISLPDWIKHVIACRQQQTAAEKAAAIQSGLAEIARTGTVAVGEIATQPFDDSVYLESEPQLQKTIFLEQLTTNADLIADRCTAAAAHASRPSQSVRITHGISPHAPYSVHPKLLKRLTDIAIEHSAPIAMHVAETREEIELLDSQSGKFVELLRGLGAWNPTAETNANSIDVVIEQLARSNRVLLVHGNYLTETQLQTVSQHNISIAYCPRTHAWFGHSTWPLKLAIELGINVCLGTDSRVSNPDLNLLSELKTVAKLHPEIRSEVVLKLGTINAATALGIAATFGSIEPGKSANLCLISNESAKSFEKTDPFWWLRCETAAASPVRY